MKILYIVNDLSSTNGWSTYACHLIEEAVRQGHDVHVVVEREIAYANPRVSQYAVLAPPLTLLWNPLGIFMQWITVRRVLERVAPDVVHVIVEPYVLLFAFARTPIPLVLTVHGTYATLPRSVPQGMKRRMSTYLFMRALKRVQKVICVSEATQKKFLTASYGFGGQDVCVIHNAIELPKAESSIEKKDDRKISVLTVGEVKRRKGIHDAIAVLSAWADLHKKPVVYTVAGHFDERNPYVAMVKKMAEEATSSYFSVRFLGKVDDGEKTQLHQHASLYIHLERVDATTVEVEGFGISVLEAASWGVPTLAARGSAVSEAVDDGVSGYVVDLGDARGIDRALTNLLLSPILTKAGILAWAKSHAIDRIYTHVDAVYQSLCR